MRKRCLVSGLKVLSRKITRDQLALLVDIFYLPFDYGKQGLEMLEDFQFMHKNCHILRQNREMDADIVFEWNCRFENFQSKASRLELFFRHFLNAPNRVSIIWTYLTIK